jgi:ferredoxin-fold anticodon binding domain-containing protein
MSIFRSRCFLVNSKSKFLSEIDVQVYLPYDGIVHILHLRMFAVLILRSGKGTSIRLKAAKLFHRKASELRQWKVV